jgi:hypothetical protein
MEFPVHLFTYFPLSDVLPLFYLTHKQFLAKIKRMKEKTHINTKQPFIPS